MRQKQNDGKFFQTTKRGEIQEIGGEFGTLSIVVVFFFMLFLCSDSGFPDECH